MARYIDAEKIPYYIAAADDTDPSGKKVAFKADIDKIPAEDVRPERHGRWIPNEECVVCSECGEEHCWEDYRASYCEDCGAKMDGGEENG